MNLGPPYASRRHVPSNTELFTPVPLGRERENFLDIDLAGVTANAWNASKRSWKQHPETQMKVRSPQY